jgi:hypothetical protein
VLNTSGLFDGETFRARGMNREVDGQVDLGLLRMLLETMIRTCSEERKEQAYLGSFLGSLLCASVFLVLILVHISW